MSRRALSDCNGEVVGGLQANIDAAVFSDPNSKILELRRYWCGQHEGVLAGGLRNGRYLSYDELD